MKPHVALYVLVIGLFLSAAFMVFGGSRWAGAILLVLCGVLAIIASRSMATAQNKVNHATRRVVWNPWGPTTPRLFVLWGVGILIVGLAWLLL